MVAACAFRVPSPAMLRLGCQSKQKTYSGSYVSFFLILKLSILYHSQSDRKLHFGYARLELLLFIYRSSDVAKYDMYISLYYYRIAILMHFLDVFIL